MSRKAFVCFLLVLPGPPLFSCAPTHLRDQEEFEWMFKPRESAGQSARKVMFGSADEKLMGLRSLAYAEQVDADVAQAISSALRGKDDYERAYAHYVVSCWAGRQYPLTAAMLGLLGTEILAADPALRWDRMQLIRAVHDKDPTSALAVGLYRSLLAVDDPSVQDEARFALSLYGVSVAGGFAAGGPGIKGANGR